MKQTACRTNHVRKLQESYKLWGTSTPTDSSHWLSFRSRKNGRHEKSNYPAKWPFRRPSILSHILFPIRRICACFVWILRTPRKKSSVSRFWDLYWHVWIIAELESLTVTRRCFGAPIFVIQANNVHSDVRQRSSRVVKEERLGTTACSHGAPVPLANLGSFCCRASEPEAAVRPVRQQDEITGKARWSCKYL
jgi:hypothetical protein